MMKSGEFSGHSIDEAVFHGLQELGLSIDEVSIETLQTETKGLFGIGAKLARVRLVQRPPEEVEEQRERARAPREERGDYRRNERQYDRGERPPRQDKDPRIAAPGPRQNSVRHDRDPRVSPPGPQYAYSEQLAKEMPAGIFLKELLEKMNVSAKVLAVNTEDGVRLRIDSDTHGLLIGRRGETLDALQYVTSLYVNKDKDEKYIRVTLDTEDYRSKREDTLARLARRQASRVKASGRPVSMEPMNPYERRVMHASLQNNPYVSTHSEGEEPNRRVVITPKR